MIFIIMILSLVIFSLLNVFAKKRWQTGVSLLFIALFLISLVLVVANDHYHFGMKKQTETTTQTLVSSTPNAQAKLLLYQPLGNGTEKVYLYRTNESQKKPQPTGTDHVSNRVVKNSAQNELTTKKTYWVYKNDAMKLWFNWSSNKQFISEKNTFHVTDDWLVLSTTQAKKLAKLVAQNKPQMENQAKAFVAEKVKAAMSQNPTLDDNAKQQVVQQATAEFQQQAMAKIVAEVTK